jgi:DNA-binding transcriptional ArsR family regulator
VTAGRPANGQGAGGRAGRHPAGPAGRDANTDGRDGRDATGPNGRDAAAVARFVERFAAVLVEAGFPRMPARVCAALLVTDEGTLTAAELADQLRISPAAVSGAVRYLSHLGLVSREREPGSRRDRYRLVNDTWFEVTARRDGILAAWETASREGVDVLGPDTPAGRRFAESSEYFGFLGQELAGLLDRWRQHKARAAATPDPAGQRPAHPG